MHSTSSSYILFIINLLHQVEFGNHLQFHMIHPKSMSICKYCTKKKLKIYNLSEACKFQATFRKNCQVKAKILVFPVPWLSLLRLFVNMNMGSYPQDLISIHFLKCICNNINLWKHYLRSICYIFMELSYTRHVYSICCSLLQNFLICIMLDSAVCSLLLVQHHTCVCVVTITTCIF